MSTDIFLADPIADRRIGFGDNFGKPVWTEVPGEHRNTLRRLIVTQGDTEPASVEQQRALGHSCPSLYDLRNLFQINVEEGRHLWAMAYLLHSYFGRDGREEAEALLDRRSGDADRPRILGAFNEPCTDWLSLFMFTFFTDRDGKFQLLALAESSFDPLARTTRFMLTEEAHHMFVGETGVGRIVRRTAELMKKDDDVRRLGGIDLPTIQKYLNLWYSVSLDLFGSEISSNAASFFADGLKGRPKEPSFEDHLALDRFYSLEVPGSRGIVTEEVPLRNAINEVLRDAYVEDCQRGVDRWNEILKKAGVGERLNLPSRRFHRRIGVYANVFCDPEGRADQPFSVTDEIGADEDADFPPPAVVAIGTEVIVPLRFNGTDQLACFEGNEENECHGLWPVDLSESYDSEYGAAFPLMDNSGFLTGFCLPTGVDPCYSFQGTPVATPDGMTGAIPATLGWNGPALAIGPRVYVPNANENGIDCYDYSTGAACPNYPLYLSDLGLLYTVNPDPERPDCIWVNSDNGEAQIQNFEASTGVGTCE